METAKQRKARRLSPVPAPSSALGALALALRETRAAKGLTQAQTATAIGVSTSTVQRAESGRSAPEWHIVSAYATQLDLNQDRAKSLWSSITAPDKRRTLTPAPAVRLLKNEDDFVDALKRAWEEAGKPSMHQMKARAERAREASAQYVYLSSSAANRIKNRRQLPSSPEQLRSYLIACLVPESRFPVWLEAYGRVKAKTREEALAKKKTDKEDQKRWLGWEGRRQALHVLDFYGLDPVEPFAHSSTAPWAVRCRGCQRLSRLRLIDIVSRRRGCQSCPLGHPAHPPAFPGGMEACNICE
ncbi:helix-turn-helix domain-containing protein [Streptomyces sp. NPDC088730]|uniref:helix-turn-helix domain-containing protein n=1 Tax=Streptomyces sp. NPDC088730 TaxID=3365877 RepID=UPI00380D8172